MSDVNTNDTIIVTFFKNYGAREKREAAMSCNALLEIFTNQHARTKSALPWIEFSRFGNKRTPTGSLRHDANVLAIFGLLGDYDGERVSFDEAAELVRAAGIAAFIYTTPSHTDSAPRWRVAPILSGELPPDQHHALMDRLNGVVGGVLAAESWTLSQACYFGFVAGNGTAHRAVFIPGDPIDRRDDLPAIGKPATAPGDGFAAGAFDEDAVIENIVTGAAYHEPTVRLAGYWAARGVPQDEACCRVEEVFDRAEIQDARWSQRRRDVVRCVRDIYAKEAKKPESGLPVVRVVGGGRHKAADAGITALIAAGAAIYQRGKNLVYVARFPAKAADGSMVLTPGVLTVPAPLLMRELGRAARWEGWDGRMKGGGGWKRIDPPSEVAAQIAAMVNEWPFAPLRGIISTQTLRPDGSLLTTPGYDAATGFVLFAPPPMPPVPAMPTRADALAALGLLDGLLDEFPFADPESRSVALSMLMTPVARAALAPAVPLHVARAPDGGSGKSYLADIAAAIAIGERCPVIGVSVKSDETEKRLVGAALTGQPIVSIDNCNGELRSEFLCQAVERPLIQMRPLGGSEMPIIPNSFSCFANGNNIEIADDLVRRAIQCSLDANVERPEEREFTKNPFATVTAERGSYVAAVLTMILAYLRAGKPDRPRPFLSFDAWSDIVRGPLIWLGRADPVKTVTALRVTDPVREVVAEVFAAVMEVSDGAGGSYTADEIVQLSFVNDALLSALTSPSVARDEDGSINAKKLGWWLRRHVNKVAMGIKMTRDDSMRYTRWVFMRAGETSLSSLSSLS